MASSCAESHDSITTSASKRIQSIKRKQIGLSEAWMSQSGIMIRIVVTQLMMLVQVKKMKNFDQSVFKSDFYIEKLKVRTRSSYRCYSCCSAPCQEGHKYSDDISESMCPYANRQMLTEMHKLLRLYLTIPIRL